MGCIRVLHICHSIADIIIIATEHTLHQNLSIYQEWSDGNLQANKTQQRQRCSLEVYAGFPASNSQHHDALLLHAKSCQVSFSDEGQACDIEKDNIGRHSPTREQMRTQPEYEVINLRDSEVSDM